MHYFHNSKMRLSHILFMRQLLLFFFAITLAVSAHSQQTLFCGFDVVMEKLEATHPGTHEACTAFYSELPKYEQGGARSAVYQVPVVFHVVWNTESQNLSDEVIFDQMAILNQDYRRLNPNAVDTREIFLPVAADTEIEFYLADTDPDGNPTTGINRIETDRESFEFDLFAQDITIDEVKFASTGGADAWDTDRYLNIWVCNITTSIPGAQIFGFAYPPNGAPNWDGLFPAPIADDVEGVVVHYTVIGSNNPAAGEDNFPNNEGGRTLTHEVGHYLGLRHTWGDAFFNGCSADDGIEDTPNINANNNFACNFNANTCNDGDDDLPDMGENYMDYNQDDCLNLFTLGQRSAMRFVLENFREELIEGQFVSVQEATLPSISLYPNPVSNTCVVNTGPGAHLVINASNGAQLFETSVTTSSVVLNFAEYQPGVYFVRDLNSGAVQRVVKH
jgi:hypothetical protein